MINQRGNHDLIERCRRGERQAQEQIYRQYYHAMYNISYRLLNDQHEAEDVMQEAFLAAFTKIGHYRGDVTFGSWLKRIVINKSIDVLRTKKMQFEEIKENIEYIVDWEHVDDSNEEEVERQVLQIRKTLQKLPDGFRVILSLYLFEGYDHGEIAQILNISESTSRSQLVRAKRKLTELLEDNKNETN